MKKSLKLKKPLSQAEAAKFAPLDEAVVKGAKTFMEVGMALVHIHKGKLYRELFGTFEAYAENRGIQRKQAYRLMTAVQMTLELKNVSNLSHGSTHINKGDVEKSSAFALQKLAEAPKARRAEIFSKAAVISDGPPTAAAIIEVTAEVMHKALPGPVEQPAAATPPEPDAAAAAALPPPVAIYAAKTIFTPARFDIELKAIEARVNQICGDDQEERIRYGIVANALAGRLMNAKAKEVNFYGQ